MQSSKIMMCLCHMGSALMCTWGATPTQGAMGSLGGLLVFLEIIFWRSGLSRLLDRFAGYHGIQLTQRKLICSMQLWEGAQATLVRKGWEAREVWEVDGGGGGSEQVERGGGQGMQLGGGVEVSLGAENGVHRLRGSGGEESREGTRGGV